MVIPKLGEDLTVESVYNSIVNEYKKDANFLDSMKGRLREYDTLLSEFLSDGQRGECAATIVYLDLQQKAIQASKKLPKVSEDNLSNARYNLRNVSSLDIETLLDEKDPSLSNYITALHTIFPQVFIPLRESATLIMMYEALNLADKSDTVKR